MSFTFSPVLFNESPNVPQPPPQQPPPADPIVPPIQASNGRGRQGAE